MSRLRDVSHFAAASSRARSVDDLRALMEPITREMGFDCYALLRHVASFKDNPYPIAIHDYPRDWVDYYIDHNMRPHDPALLASPRRAVGFRFDEIPALIEMSEASRNVMLEASRRGGITDGFHIPVHVPGEVSGSCTFIVRNGRPLPIKNLLMAQLIGYFAHEAARQILWPSHDGAAYLSGTLTARQLECILLVARGKTDWEIAQLLGISENTVTAHINEARRRYGVSRRSQLPIQALVRGDLGFGDIIK